MVWTEKGVREKFGKVLGEAEVKSFRSSALDFFLPEFTTNTPANHGRPSSLDALQHLPYKHSQIHLSSMLSPYLLSRLLSPSQTVVVMQRCARPDSLRPQIAISNAFRNRSRLQLPPFNRASKGKSGERNCRGPTPGEGIGIENRPTR